MKNPVVIFWIAAFFTLPSPSEFASELHWLAHPYLDTSSTFFFAGLFEDASVYHKYEMCCLAAKLSTPGLLGNIPM